MDMVNLAMEQMAMYKNGHGKFGHGKMAMYKNGHGKFAHVKMHLKMRFGDTCTTFSDFREK